MNKVSPGLLLSVGSAGTFMKIFGLGLAVLGLHGTLVLHPGERAHHSGFMYLLGPWVFPGLIALIYTFSPFRPYRGGAFVQKKRDIDTNDPVVVRLAELYKSSEARRHLWRQALKLSGILFFVMGVLAIVLRHSLSWSPSPIDLLGVVFACMGSWIVLATDYIGWGLRSWVEAEASHHLG